MHTQDRLIERAVQLTLRYCPLRWHTDLISDLRQEAHLLYLKAQRTYSPAHGYPLEDHARAVILKCLPARAHRLLSPLYTGWRTAKRLRTQGVYALVVLPYEDIIPSPLPSPEKAASQAELRAEVRRLLSHLLPGEEREMLPVLIGEKTPEEVAAEHDLSVQRVYQILQNVRRRLKKSPALKRAWKEL